MTSVAEIRAEGFYPHKAFYHFREVRACYDLNAIDPKIEFDLSKGLWVFSESCGIETLFKIHGVAFGMRAMDLQSIKADMPAKCQELGLKFISGSERPVILQGLAGVFVINEMKP